MANPLPGNPYATDELEDVARTHSAEAAATLALAFEQRTANLIAMATGDDSFGLDPDSWGEIREDIITRLGLDEIQADFDAEATADNHPHEPCREKHRESGICMGNECVSGGNGLRMNLQCPCQCHEGGYPWN